MGLQQSQRIPVGPACQHRRNDNHDTQIDLAPEEPNGLRQRPLSAPAAAQVESDIEPVRRSLPVSQQTQTPRLALEVPHMQRPTASWLSAPAGSNLGTFLTIDLQQQLEEPSISQHFAVQIGPPFVITNEEVASCGLDGQAS